MAAVQRVPAGDRTQGTGQTQERRQAAQDQAINRRWLSLTGVLVLSAGCLAPRPADLAPITGMTPASAILDARGLDERSSEVLTADLRAPAGTQPTLVRAQQIPPPRPIPPLPPDIDRKARLDPVEPPSPVPSIRGSGTSAGGPLTLEEVLASVEMHYPLLRAIEQERAIAGGRLVSTMGAFDLNLGAGANNQGPATYNNFASTLSVSQALPFGGINVFGGWRNGLGDFPNYSLGQKTADGGEFRAGISIPLLRDRAIDRPRASVQQARLDVQIAEPTIEAQRLLFQRAAARVYWNWVGSGQRLQVTESLVKFAVDRDEQLKGRVEAGRTARIERVDNQQNIALRNGVLVQAQRAFQQATIDLSLFFRDDQGNPALAGFDRLPRFPAIQAPDVNSFYALLQTALELRPEPRRLRLLRDKANVDLQLAMNQVMPTLNAVVSGSQDVGFGKSSSSGPNGLDRASLNAGLLFQLPVQRREARGRVMLAQAQLVQLEQQYRNAVDVVRAEVQDAFSAVERAYEFFEQARKRVNLAREVAVAERQQLLLGQSDILRVTLREQAAFEAEVVEISAQQEYFRALADLRAAVGQGGR